MTPQGPSFRIKEHIWHKRKAINTNSEQYYWSSKPHKIPFALTWSAFFLVVTLSFFLVFFWFVSLFPLHKRNLGLWTTAKSMYTPRLHRFQQLPKEELEMGVWSHFSTFRRASHHFKWKIAHLPGSPESAPCRLKGCSLVGYNSVNTPHCMPLHFLNRKN